ncbi:MAG: spore coat associated protein CotJA [Oscillospiraceae bacterium]|nr:spore coat associated protein CotJA [Oscillospiraceae bacterium]
MEIHAFQKLAENAELFEASEAVSAIDSGDADCIPSGLQPQPTTVFPDVTPPGMAYVPYQLWSSEIYDPEKGLQQGTMFPVLDLPFCPEGGACS